MFPNPASAAATISAHMVYGVMGISRETLLEQHPWVEDVQRELGRLRREQAVSDSEKGEAT